MAAFEPMTDTLGTYVVRGRTLKILVSPPLQAQLSLGIREPSTNIYYGICCKEPRVYTAQRFWRTSNEVACVSTKCE